MKKNYDCFCVQNRNNLIFVLCVKNNSPSPLYKLNVWFLKWQSQRCFSIMDKWKFFQKEYIALVMVYCITLFPFFSVVNTGQNNLLAKLTIMYNRFKQFDMDELGNKCYMHTWKINVKWMKLYLEILHLINMVFILHNWKLVHTIKCSFPRKLSSIKYSYIFFLFH